MTWAREPTRSPWLATSEPRPLDVSPASPPFPSHPSSDASTAVRPASTRRADHGRDREVPARARRERRAPARRQRPGVPDHQRAPGDLMIDPLERWREFGEKPDYAGLLTFARHALHPGRGRARGRRRGDRRRADGRPRLRPPGRPLRPARDPRRVAARPARTSRRAIDAFAELRVVDFGDAPVIPADPAALARRDRGDRRRGGRRGRAARSSSGGDHSIAEPDVRAVRGASHGPVGAGPLRHPHRHRRRRSSASSCSHGTLMYRLVERRPRRPAAATRRSACAATGRARRSSAGRPSAASRRFFMHDVRDLGIREVVDARAGRGRRRPGVPDASTSMCSTRPSRPAAPARPSRAG